MKISLSYGRQDHKSNVLLLGAFGSDKGIELPKWPKHLKNAFMGTPNAKAFRGQGTSFVFHHNDCTCIALGLGSKKDFKAEKLRKELATAYKSIKGKYQSVAVHLDSIATGPLESTAYLASETIFMSDYHFDKYLSKNEGQDKTKEVVLVSSSSNSAKSKKALEKAQKVASSINTARRFVDEPPNVLRSTTYAKEIEKDVKTNLKSCGVRIKIMGKKELKSEKMGLFLSVNAGSAFDPQLVHLTYTPKKATKKTKHVVLVGKGLVFDTGGYSLKPSPGMAGMKYDMAGSATVYGAFRAAALLGAKTKVTCILGITDNAVNARATMPDSIVRGRNGKTVEILNTDAEGRLVLADCLDYACDQKPDFLIDAATLTGACLVALGTEVCGLMGNNRAMANKLLQSAKRQGEYMWQLPIVEEFQKDMKSKIADLKNIGGNRFAGTPKAAAFLQEFVREGVPWGHLDIAGVANAQAHLPYCPSGGSGLIVRSLVDFIEHV